MAARSRRKIWRLSLIELVIIVVSVAFTALPLLAGFVIIRDIGLGVASLSWKPVEARVIVEAPEAPITTPQFTYEYEVGGRKFRGWRISYRDSGDDADRVRNLRVGDTITAFHDQDRPARAVLSPGTNVWAFFWLAFAALFGLVTSSLGIGIVVAAYGSSRALDAAIMFLMRSMLALFTLIPAAFVVVLSGEIHRGIASGSWPSVQGTILANDLLEKERPRSSSDGKQDENPALSNRIRYAYEVDGRRYRGERIGFTSSFPTREAALERHRDLPVGGPVTVYYNPANPADAVLENGTGPYLFVYLAIATVGIIVFGIPFYRSCRRRSARGKPTA